MFTNKALIAQYEARIADLQKVLEIVGGVYAAEMARKDADIAELKAQLKPADTGNVVPFTTYEADTAISGKQELVEALSPEDEAILAERDRILSGTY